MRSIWTDTRGAELAETLAHAYRASTIRQFQTCWTRFQEFTIAAGKPLITQKFVMQFPYSLFKDRGLAASTVLVYRSALAGPIALAFNIQTSDQEFKLMSKSFFLERPPRSPILPNWSLKKVLVLLTTPRFSSRNIDPLDSLMGALFLTALASGNRVSEMSAMLRSGIAYSKGHGKITVPTMDGFLYNNQRQHRPPNIVINLSRLRTAHTPYALSPVSRDTSG